jgi:hypothetical protein
MDSPQREVLDMDSTEIPVHGQQELSAYNGHFESTCYHPLLLFNGEGDCSGAKLRPGNMHSAERWEELLLPEVERQQELGKDVVFRADAASAKPEIYEAMEECGVKYAIRLPARMTVWSATSRGCLPCYCMRYCAVTLAFCGAVVQPLAAVAILMSRLAAAAKFCETAPES